jgi:hypothetical protein
MIFPIYVLNFSRLLGLDAGYWMLDAGYWMLDAGYWMLDTGYSILELVD